MSVKGPNKFPSCRVSLWPFKRHRRATQFSRIFSTRWEAQQHGRFRPQPCTAEPGQEVDLLYVGRCQNHGLLFGELNHQSPTIFGHADKDTKRTRWFPVVCHGLNGDRVFVDYCKVNLNPKNNTCGCKATNMQPRAMVPLPGPLSRSMAWVG